MAWTVARAWVMALTLARTIARAWVVARAWVMALTFS